MPQLTGIRGANYHASWGWNAYQEWAFYDTAQSEQELDYAVDLGLNSLRVNLSYEFWREQAIAFDNGETNGNSAIGALEHFLTQCNDRGIKPVLILFEAPPQADAANVDLGTYRYGVKSPSPSEILQTRDWSDYFASPQHFVTRLANKFNGDDRVGAVEIMNEPGSPEGPIGHTINRHDFVVEMASAYTDADSTTPLTIGTKDTKHAAYYANDRGVPLDVWQFHMNLPPDREQARSYIEQNVMRSDKPVWCTEWQRTQETPPNVALPYLNSLAPEIDAARDDGILDGDHFWGLMFKPAYLSKPRQNVGRTNGVFHPDGTVFYKPDADAVAGRDTGLTERTEYPAEWEQYPEYSAFPDPSELQGGGGGGNSRMATVLGVGALAYLATKEDK